MTYCFKFKNHKYTTLTKILETSEVSFISLIYNSTSKLNHTRFKQISQFINARNICLNSICYHVIEVRCWKIAWAKQASYSKKEILEVLYEKQCSKLSEL